MKINISPPAFDSKMIFLKVLNSLNSLNTLGLKRILETPHLENPWTVLRNDHSAFLKQKYAY